MGQVTETTIKMIEEHAARGEHAPLTVWELRQLAHAWRKANSLQLADVTRTMPADFPSGATSLGTYRNVDDGATYTWGKCDDGFFRFDQFGWATWPTQESFSRALLLAAAPQAPAAPSVNERAAYVEFLAGKFPQTYSKEGAEHWWDHGHVSALTWQAARAVAAAPAAPAVDASPLIARNLAEWHEDDGDVSWWAWCGNGWAGEPAWIGRPTDDGWPGYHTHWTAHPAMPPAIAAQAAAKGERES